MRSVVVLLNRENELRRIRDILVTTRMEDEEKKAQKLVKILGEHKRVPETLVKKGNPLPKILVASTQQDKKKIDQEFMIAEWLNRP